MYDFSLQLLKSLHDDHMATMALLERVEAALERQGNDVPAQDDPTMRPLLTDITAVMVEEVKGHFAFEEEHLFPRFAEMADMGIPMMLKGEHDIIRPLAARLVELAKNALEGGFDAETWAEFSEKGRELVERELFHIQKEEMGFLPALDQMLDPEEDGALQMAYAECKSAA